MAYKALYRTYRPDSFDQVAGQKHIVQTLKHAVEKEKIAHAYLFCGPRGTGKTSIAKIFAKMINCTAEDKKPCSVCDNCLSVQEGNHPDIIEIDAASNNGVEEVRSLIEKVKYAPLKGKYKIYIIDEVHMMSTGAFNALLKTIEEPPEHVIFILATTEAHKVLPTIISRCQRFDFTKVSKSEIVKRIHVILKKENIKCEEEVITIISELADGGLRDALSILDQCIAYAQNDLKTQHINEIYGITTVKEKIDMFIDIFENNVLSLLDRISYLIEKGIDVKRLTMDLIELLKEALIFEYTKDSSLLNVLSSEQAMLFTNHIKANQKLTMIHILMETYDKYRNAANPSSYFEVCILEMLDIFNKKETVVYKENNVKKKSITPEREDTLKINVSRETFIKEKPVLYVPEDDDQSPYESTIDDNYSIPVISDVNELNSLDMNMNDTKEKKIVNKKVIKYSSVKPLDENLILSLLGGANKPEKAMDIENFKTIEEYMLELKWAKSAMLLKNSSIVASGINYIVLSVDNQAQANEINEIDKENKFNQFIQKLLKKNKKVYAISKEYETLMIQRYVERRNEGTLPDPVQVETVDYKEKKVKEKTQEELVVELFGKENIEIKED